MKTGKRYKQLRHTRNYKRSSAFKNGSEYITSGASLEEVQRLRKKFKLRPLEDVERKCLKCDEMFYSEGWHNRVCDECKYIQYIQPLKGDVNAEQRLCKSN